MKDPRKVEVEWQDANQDSGAGWLYPEEAMRKSPAPHLKNVGYFVGRDNRNLLIAQSFRHEDALEREAREDKLPACLFRDIMVIPSDNVIRIRTLK